MKLPTATTARRYCCCATAKPCAKARLKAWTDEAFCTWKRQRANRRSSAAKSACGTTTDRFPCRSGGIRNVLLLDGGNEMRLKWAMGGKRHVRNRRQRAVPRFVAFGRGVGGKGGWKCPHRRLRRVRRIQKAQVKEQLARKNRVAAVFRTGFGHTQPLPPPRRTRPDRWFNALGSRRFSRNACVVVSCGTAVTVDALTDDGHYLGNHHARLPPDERIARRPNRQPQPPRKQTLPFPDHNGQRRRKRHDGRGLRLDNDDAR